MTDSIVCIAFFALRSVKQLDGGRIFFCKAVLAIGDRPFNCNMAMLAEFEILKITELFPSSLEPRVWTATSRSARWTAATWPSCSPSRWSGSPTRASPPTSSGKQQALALLNTWTYWALLVQQSQRLQVQNNKSLMPLLVNTMSTLSPLIH